MAISTRSCRLLPLRASRRRARITPSWEPAAAKFRCERLMAAYAWWCNGRASDGANSLTSEDHGHEAFASDEPCRLEFAAVDDGNDPGCFAGPDPGRHPGTHPGTHTTTNHKQSRASCSFCFCSTSCNACCARFA